jgi:N,N-dimethylformamidase beta subunit-like, C-terminal
MYTAGVRRGFAFLSLPVHTFGRTFAGVNRRQFLVGALGLVAAAVGASFELDRWLGGHPAHGCYLLKLVAPIEGIQQWIPLTVRDDSSHSAFLMMNAVTEWQAYNEWGGYSVYFGRGRGGRSFQNRGRIVSFDRPYDQPGGAGDFIGLEFPLIQLMEQRGFDVSYVTSVDVHRHPELVLQHRALLSPGHDEYWSKPMRDGAEAARDHGVNLAFFGANAAYRQIRFESSAIGPDRHQICYKAANEDPMRKMDPSLVTVNWRDAPVNRPENAMIGPQYKCNPVSNDMVIVAPDAWVFENTGVTMNQAPPDRDRARVRRLHAGKRGTDERADPGPLARQVLRVLGHDLLHGTQRSRRLRFRLDLVAHQAGATGARLAVQPDRQRDHGERAAHVRGWPRRADASVRSEQERGPRLKRERIAKVGDG